MYGPGSNDVVFLGGDGSGESYSYTPRYIPRGSVNLPHTPHKKPCKDWWDETPNDLYSQEAIDPSIDWISYFSNSTEDAIQGIPKEYQNSINYEKVLRALEAAQKDLLEYLDSSEVI